MSSWPDGNRRITVHDLRAAKERNERWAMLTAYDSLVAPLFEDADIKVLLVGDSAAMVVFGHENTIAATLDEMVILSSAVTRTTKRALIVGDLPFGTYYDPSMAQASAVRLFKEGGVGAVKLEGAAPQHIEAITSVGMPVMAHLGLTPQSVNALGGFKVQGRGESGQRVLQAAKEAEAAGAFAVVLEAIPAALAAEITNAISIPTIGIGAGNACDAQVLVWQDMVGLTTGRAPKFVKRYADVASVISQAAAQFQAEVQSGEFPGVNHSYQ